MAQPGGSGPEQLAFGEEFGTRRQRVQPGDLPGGAAASHEWELHEPSDFSDVLLHTPELSDLDFTQGLLALLGAPDGAVPGASASLPSDGLPSTAADAEPDARHGAEQLVVSELGAPDELPGSSGGAAAVDILRSTSGDTAIPKAGRDDDARQARTRQTNRASQQRWRARHKVRKETTADQLERLTAEMQQMQIQQDLLLERNALLECAYAMASGGGLGAGSQPRGDKQPAMAWWLTEQMQDHLRSEMQLDGELVFTVRPGEPRRLTVAQVAALSAEEFKRLQHEYVMAFAEQLLLRAAPLHTPTADDERLAQLVFEVNQLRGAVLLGRPDHGRILCVRGGPHKAIGNPTDLGAAESPANSAKHQAWVQAVAATQLTEQQLQAVLSIRAAYINNAAILARRRPALVEELQALPPEGVTAATQAVITRNAELVEAMAALRCFLRDEHSNLVQAIWYICRRVLTPVQEAHLSTVAVSLNASPDMLSFAEVVAMSAGQPNTAAALAQVPPDAGLVSLEEALLAATV